jgi:hypothetical protein
MYICATVMSILCNIPQCLLALFYLYNKIRCVGLFVAVVVFYVIELGGFGYGSTFRMIMISALRNLIKNFPWQRCETMGKVLGQGELTFLGMSDTLLLLCSV